MKAQSNLQERPELSLEERILRDRVKQARKVRWIGADASGERAGRLPTPAALFFEANLEREAACGNP